MALETEASLLELTAMYGKESREHRKIFRGWWSSLGGRCSIRPDSDAPKVSEGTEPALEGRKSQGEHRGLALPSLDEGREEEDGTEGEGKSTWTQKPRMFCTRECKKRNPSSRSKDYILRNSAPRW